MLSFENNVTLDNNFNQVARSGTVWGKDPWTFSGVYLQVRSCCACDGLRKTHFYGEFMEFWSSIQSITNLPSTFDCLKASQSNLNKSLQVPLLQLKNLFCRTLITIKHFCQPQPASKKYVSANLQNFTPFKPTSPPNWPYHSVKLETRRPNDE